MKSSKGFTLLEVMIVLGILGGLIALGLPRLQGQKNKSKAFVRQFGALTKEVRNLARMKRMTYRIAIQMKDPHSYWIEAAAGSVAAPSMATLEKLQKLSQEERPADPFKKVDKPIKERELPSGLKFKSVETPAVTEAIENGMAYVYFSPEGLVEQAVIQVTNEQQATLSLIINPLTGHTEVSDKGMSLKDLKIE